MQQLASMQADSNHAEMAGEHTYSAQTVPGGAVLEGKPVSVPPEQSRQQV